MSDLPMKQEDHPAHSMPNASEQYAGDVIQFPIGDSQRRIQRETAPTSPNGYTPSGSSVVPIKRMT